MRTLVIEPGAPHQRQQVLLDGREFVVELRWNERAGAWFMAVSDAEGLILAGRRVVVDFPLLSRFASPRLPDGELFAIDTSGAGLDPGRDDLGSRVDLVYVEASELPA